MIQDLGDHTVGLELILSLILMYLTTFKDNFEKKKDHFLYEFNDVSKQRVVLTIND